MEITNITDLFSLLMLGAAIFTGLIFRYLIGSINNSYRKYGKKRKGKIIAFKEETRTTRSNGKVSSSTTICPVIEYYLHGERKLFLGTNQNYLNNFIGKEVDIYVIEEKKDYVLQEKNVYRVFTHVSLLFIIIPLIFIINMSIPIIYKITIPFFGPLILLPIFYRVKSKMQQRMKEAGETRSIREIIQEKFLKNKQMIDPSVFESSQDYIKSLESFNKKLGYAHSFGLILTSLFGVGLFFLMKHFYLEKLNNRKRQLFIDLYQDLSKFGPLFEKIGKDDEITIFFILIGFAMILLLGLIINLNGWLRSR